MNTDDFFLGRPSASLALTSPAQVNDIIETIFRQAKHTLLVRAVRLDFEIFNTTDLLLLLAPLIKGNLRNKVHFLVEDAFHFMDHQLRIIQLARSHSSYVKVRKVSDDCAGNAAFFIVADQIGYVHQTTERKFPVRADPFAPAQAITLDRRFKQHWERSQSIAGLLTAGL